jgi:hypothetical protein
VEQHENILPLMERLVQLNLWDELEVVFLSVEQADVLDHFLNPQLELNILVALEPFSAEGRDSSVFRGWSSQPFVCGEVCVFRNCRQTAVATCGVVL